MVQVVKFSDFIEFPLKCLKFIGINLIQDQNDKTFKRKFMKFYFKFFIGSLIAMETQSIITIILDFWNIKTIAQMIPQSMFAIFALVKLFTVLTQKKKIQELFVISERCFPKTAERQKTLQVSEKFKTFKKIEKLVFWPGMICCFAPCTVFIVNAIITRSWVLKFPVKLWYPFNEYDPKFHTFVRIWISWFYPNIMFALAGPDLILYNMISIISIQSDDLCEKLRDSKRFLSINKLNELLESHMNLISAAERLENIFSILVFVQFSGSSLMLCSIVFQISYDSAENLTTYMLILSAYLVQILMMCFNGSKLIEASEKIADAVYDSGWNEINDKKVKHALLLMIIRSQKPCVITAAKFVTISLRVYSSVR